MLVGLTKENIVSLDTGKELGGNSDANGRQGYIHRSCKPDGDLAHSKDMGSEGVQLADVLLFRRQCLCKKQIMPQGSQSQGFLERYENSLRGQQRGERISARQTQMLIERESLRLGSSSSCW